MRKSLFIIFIFSILTLTYTITFAAGEYDGVWFGTGTVVIGNSSEGFPAATIIYQENADLLSFYDSLFGPIKLVRFDSQWKLVSPLQITVYDMVIIFSEFTVTFQSNISCTTQITFTADGDPGTGKIIANKQNCQNLGNNSQSFGLSGAMDSYSCYQTNLKNGVKKIQVQTLGGVGDCDLTVIYQRPINNLWEVVASENFGNEETITKDSPSEGIWYTILYGYEAYSGLTLRLSYKERKSMPWLPLLLDD
jgi:hypothetical protein